MSVQIHGKEYITVAERIIELHKEFKDSIEITTEVLFQTPVVIKATLKTPKGTFTGISAANPDKSIEKQSPYEVAETSAVGRALGFAGYEIERGFATAEEMVKADVSEAFDQSSPDMPDVTPVDLGVCKKCGAKMIVSKRTGVLYCSAMCWKN